MYYQIIKVKNEETGLVWQYVEGRPQVKRIYLPTAQERMKDILRKEYPDIENKQQQMPGGVDLLVAGLYEGRKLKFDISLLNISGLSDFSVRVLKQTYKIPRGKIITYAGLAAKVGLPKASRAVGQVMAKNPFPIVIPCHRVIRSDRTLGNFGGGLEMKKELLAKEGVFLDEKGKVPLKYFGGW